MDFIQINFGNLESRGAHDLTESINYHMGVFNEIKNQAAILVL
jgi:hypothetical protein